ncbi:MAG: hypothetical protein R2939_03000 [Kofleriaceae bacterium]
MTSPTPRTFAASLLVLAALVVDARADDRGGRFGLGLVVGSPTGVSLGYRASDHTAIAGAIGLDLFDGRHAYVHGDFLFVLPPLVTGPSVVLAPYLGPGVYIADRGNRNDDRVGLGLRFPFGLALDFRRAPVQLFAELALQMPLVPDLDLDVGGAGGFRYYF